MFNQSPNKLIHHPEHGLLIPVHAKVRGKFKISAYDSDGRPQLLRTPSGDIIQPLEGVEHSNLITDAGLDAVATLDPLSTSASTSGSGYYRAQLVIGTGSAPPAFTDTALDNEVQRAASTGSFSSPSNVRELDDVEDVWRVTSTVVRVVELSQARNLTEFGFTSRTADPIYIRELIRNATGDPVPVSLGEGLFFRVDHSLVVEVGAPPAGYTEVINIEEYDAGGNLENTIPITVNWGFRAGSLGGAAIAASAGTSTFTENTIMRVVFVDNQITARRLNEDTPYARTGAIPSSRVEPSGNDAGTLNYPPYVPGSYSRIYRSTRSAGQTNGPWHGFIICGTYAAAYANNQGWLHASFTSPYTKVNTTTLRVGTVSTWGRA